MKVLSHLSGGYDSVASTLKLLQEGHDVTGLFFKLNQKYVKEEERGVVYSNVYFKNKYPNYHGIIVRNVAMEMERASAGSPSDYIPIRNLVLGTHSANIALADGFDAIAVGSKTTVVRPDDPYSFSDCSDQFYRKLEDLVAFCSEGTDSVKFLMPLLDRENLIAMSKGEVVKLIIDDGIDISRLWTCYSTGAIQCGRCYHCQEAKKAFAEIGYNGSHLFKE